MITSPTQNTAGAAATPQSQTSAAANRGTEEPQTQAQQSGSVLTSDFEVFLQMLTAQARYQDPLDPVDSTEYSAQLAQFSMVEQQVQTNDLMERLVSALTVSDTANMAQWIGMDALTTAPVNFDGNPVTIVPDVPTGADRLTLVVRDPSGAEVQRQAVPISASSYDWSGTLPDGSSVPWGTYSLELEASNAGNVIGSSPARSYGRVLETRLDNGQMQVVLDSGALVASDQVVGLRDPFN